MDSGLWPLLATAASLGSLHTLAGPDHYLPFIAMSRIGGWSGRKTLLITLLCGVGHVLSSVVLGFVGIIAGAALFRLESIESFRGAIAGWMLLAFGVGYVAWGLWRAFRNRPHTHVHVHEDGVVHRHGHVHADEHAHVHAPPFAGSDGGERRVGAMTPWILFVIFIFGPCEPLIPFLMIPAAAGGGLAQAALVTGVFAAATLLTMAVAVTVGRAGLGAFRSPAFERYGHVLAGMLVLACGVAVAMGM